jgi:hypothetical protein
MKFTKKHFIYIGIVLLFAWGIFLLRRKSNLKKEDKFNAVIEHYSKNPADSLKLEAAKFLIKNIEGQMTLDTTSVESSQVYFDLIYNTWLHEKPRVGFRYPIQTRVIDSLNKADNLPQQTPDVRYVNDADLVTEEFLIKNIDNAFFVWESMPWAKNVSFKDFCEYILPYRTSTTYSLDAREFFLRKYKFLKDSVKNTNNPFVAKDFICKEMDKWFQEDPSLQMRYPYLSPIKFSNLLKGKFGECHDANSVRITAMRAMGIPVVMDFVHNWGNSNMAHYWFKIIAPKYDTVKGKLTNINIRKPTQHIMTATSFDDPEYEDRPENIQIRYCRTVPKVYRECFERQSNSLAAIKSPTDEVPSKFNSAWIQDVTEKYVETADLTVKLRKTTIRQKYAYLCVFDNQRWVPVAWSKVYGVIANFKKMGKNIVYLPAYYQDQKIVPAADPFLLDTNGKVVSMIKSIQNETVTLHAKFPFKPNEMTNAYSIVGGRFQFANEPDLSDTVTFHTIKHLTFNITDIKVRDNHKYRFLVFQFKGMPQIQVSELAFFGLNSEGKEVKLKGKLIGSKGAYPHGTDMLYDGDRATYFKSAMEDPFTYMGIDLGPNNASKVTRIVYLPHNDDNSVVTGDTYRLHYWDNKWISLGEKTAEKQNRVVFNNVPKNALLLVENTSGGKEQRIFQYKNDHQIFW